MKKSFIFFGGVMIVFLFLLYSCGPSVYMSIFSPEESGLNLMKITDESANSVAGNGSTVLNYNYSMPPSARGVCQNDKLIWSTARVLSLSPSGDELAYMSLVNNNLNVMVRKTGSMGTATQRTFRIVNDFFWGSDDKIYFSDAVETNRSQISSTDAHRGTIMRQVTSNNLDLNPVLSNDGKKLFFTRIDRSGEFVWAYDLSTGALTSCCKGFNPYPIGTGSEEFICVRNSSFGTSEIWHVNYDKGQETLILSDKNRGFTNPCVSPDGQWILCQGNSTSSISKKPNLDIFAVKIDGTDFTQLTYHPADDSSPVWSKDGKEIYFISSRANDKNAFNIWKMRFDL